jgi:hypothetical protein
VTIAAINGQKLRNTMRTKTLIIASALVAAGIVTSAAQVFSVNVVGYVNVTVPAGFSMIANPLNNTEGNTLSNLIPAPEFGTTVYRWNGATFDGSSFLGAWIPDFEVNPGQGLFIELASASTLTFVGEVNQGELVVNLPAGFEIISNTVPAEETLTEMGIPAEFGDTAFFFRDGNYDTSASFLGAWIPDTVGPRVGEAFWIQKGAAATWSRTFNVNE